MLRRKTSENDPADWFALAENRLVAADSLWKHEGLTTLGIEGLQQAVEQYLKGYLIAKGWKLVKTHELAHLVKQAVTFNKVFSKFQQFALDLTDDFFAQHYPGGDMTNVGCNYEQLRESARDLLAEIKKDLPTSFPTL